MLRSIGDLEARALRCADRVDDLERRLRSEQWRQRVRASAEASAAGFWSRLFRRLKPERGARAITALEQDKARAQAALKIAVDELYQAHCEQLRAAPWGRSLIAPTEAGLRDANDEYHPWNRVLMAGKRAIQALHGVSEVDGLDATVGAAALLIRLAAGSSGGGFASGPSQEQIDAMNRAGEAIQSFVNSLRLLARERPEVRAPADSPALQAIADRLKGVRTRPGFVSAGSKLKEAARTISALMTVVARTSGVELGGVETAEERLDQLNNQLGLAAWSKIPARLRPSGR